MVSSVITGRENGDEGDRTLNPRLAKAVLSQLSYVPDGMVATAGTVTYAESTAGIVANGMRAPRFELGTSTLSG